MSNRISYLCEIENLVSINGYKTSRGLNGFFMDLINLKNETLRKYINFFTPLLKIFNVLFSLVYVMFIFNKRLLNSFVKREVIYPNDIMLYLDISIFLVARSKASGLFVNSQYWVRSKCMKPVGDLTGKTIIVCEDYLTPGDCCKALYLSLIDVIIYLFKFDCIYPVYKSFYYYCVYLSLEKITSTNTLLFSNQCDRWALMFDALPSKSKILLQHGLAHPSQRYLYKLKNIDIFYSISKQTWQVPYDVNLACKPELRFMNPTINLTTIDKKRTLFLITHPMHFELEKKIINQLSKLDINIYLKTHPTVRNVDSYESLCNQYNVSLVKYYPMVDYVISYYSTLAFEYMAADIPVFLYDKDNDVNIDDMVNEIKDKLVSNYQVIK